LSSLSRLHNVVSVLNSKALYDKCRIYRSDIYQNGFPYNSLIFAGETTNKDREIKKCLTEAYKKTDDEFLQEASKA